MAFSSRKVEFCGKERTFKRCPNRTLKDYQNKLEDLQDDLKPITAETKEIQFRLDHIEDEIEVINQTLALTEKLSESSDEIIIQNMELAKKKLELKEEAHKIELETEAKFGEQKEFFKEIDVKLNECYAEFASLIFKNFDVEEYEEQADAKDAIIAPRLAELYRKATSGASQKEVDDLYNQILTESSSFQ